MNSSNYNSHSFKLCLKEIENSVINLKQKNKFIETKQKKNFDMYNEIFKQSKERLNTNGKMILHLGKSAKKDMGAELLPIAKTFFNNARVYSEDVSQVEKHGITDKGSVNIHQYLIAY